MPQFHPLYFFAQIIWLALCFGALWGIMHWKVIPYFQEIRKWRKSTLHEIISQAQTLQQKAEGILLENQKDLDQVRRKTKHLLDEVLKKTQKELHVFLYETRTQHQERLEALRAQLELEKKEIFETLEPSLLPLTTLFLNRYGKAASENEVTAHG
jgi:F0F1-type ATP synthase membrane subunit b/b'